VFRNRYKSEGIYNEKHLYNCVRYIYNNPVKAGICSQAKEYQYSNYKELNSKYKEINENLIDEYSFIDIEDDNLRKSENVIKEILRKYNKNLDDIRKNKKELKEFITILKKKEGISLRKIADELKLSRESVRRIYIK
ncbi:MAG: V-type ATPase 116kDa subunit family protein, partial [Clostridia bacterium]|nr:V-type ATPase 116kDa subunit family protein [Clostridia bacterium]